MGIPPRRLAVIVAGATIGVVAASITAFAVWSSRQAPRVALHPATSVSPTPSTSFDPGNGFGVIPSSPSASPTASIEPTAVPEASIASTPPQTAGAGPPLPASSTPNPNQAMIGADVDGRPILASTESWPGRDTTSMTTTWKWNGARWNAVRSDLPVGIGGAMVYESHLRKIVQLAGGITGIPYTMWGYDSTGWAQIQVTVPSPGLDIALLSWDPPRHQLVALVAETTERSSTWTFDGVTWTKAATAVNPPARRRGGMAYDNNTSSVVLYGGDRIVAGSGPQLNDTWTWDGTTWTEKHPATTPGGCEAQLAYDAAASQMALLCQGQSSGVTMWSWTSGTWARQHPNVVPLESYSLYMTYDAVRGELVYFGQPKGSPGSQTWTYANGQWKRVT